MSPQNVCSTAAIHNFLQAMFIWSVIYALKEKGFAMNHSFANTARDEMSSQVDEMSSFALNEKTESLTILI